VAVLKAVLERAQEDPSLLCDLEGVGPIAKLEKAFAAICERERCPFAVVGEATQELHLTLTDSEFDNAPVDLPMSVLFGKAPRFVRAAKMLDAYDERAHASPTEYALDMLREIRIRGWNKWAILVDVKKMSVYFHTNGNRELRYIAFASVDFSEGPTELLDIHGDLSGDLATEFVDYTYERNLAHAEERAKYLFRERFKGLVDNGVTARIYAKRFADYSARMRTVTGSEPDDLERTEARYVGE